MIVRGLALLEDFWKKHRDAESPLRKWLVILAAADWRNFVDCRRSYPAADQVKIGSGVVTVFNIKGNRYRLVAAVFYPSGLVVIRRVMTHEEYSEDRWKEYL